MQQIMLGLVGIAIGIVMVVFARVLVNNLGSSSTIERYLGGGGTYTAWRIGGILMITIFFLYMTGLLNRMAEAVGRSVFGI